MSVLLAFVLMFGAVFASCNREPESQDPTIPEKPSFEDTEYLLSSDQQSEYRIVIPDNADERTVFASDELVYFFRQATGVTLPVFAESDIAADADHLLVIGDTKLREAAGITLTEDIGDTGTRLVTKDSNLYLFGKTEFGDINAVYDFLELTYGYRFYAEDEFYIESIPSAKLQKFDYTFVPDIDSFAMMYGELNSGMQLTRRLRSINYYQSWISAMYAHTYFKILPPATYWSEENADWYSPATDKDTGEAIPGANLCLTRSDEMKKEFIERVKYFIEEDETRDYFMLGQEDNFGFCDCDSCKAAIAQYGSSSAVMMRFTNDVVNELNAWLAAEHPDRTVHFMTFAYNNTKTPPVVTENGEMQLVDPSVKAADNLSVMFVINNVNYAVPYYEDANVMNMLKGWSLVTDHITIWQYSTNFDNYMEPLFNWPSMRANYKTLSDYGVYYIAEQGSHNTKTATFTEMRLFVMSALARNTSLSTEALIDEFMDAYYKDAAPVMKELFDMYTNHMMKLVSQGYWVMSNGTEIMNANNWDYLLLERMLDKIDEALAVIEPLASSDPQQYSTLKNRIYKESLWIQRCELSYYPNNFADETAAYNAFVNDCYRYGITQPSEGGAW